MAKKTTSIEVQGILEQLHNPGFNPVEFDGIRKLFSPKEAMQLSPGHRPGIRSERKSTRSEGPPHGRFVVMGSKPQPSGRRSESIPARSADGLKVRLRAGNSEQPSAGGLKVRADYPRVLAPVICADLRPASSCFHFRNPARTRVPLARPPGPDWADIASDLRPEQEKRTRTHANPQPQRGGRIPARGIAPGMRIAGNTRGLKDRRITVAWGTLHAQRGMRWSFRPLPNVDTLPTQGVALGWNATPPWGLPFRRET